VDCALLADRLDWYAIKSGLHVCGVLGALGWLSRVRQRLGFVL